MAATSLETAPARVLAYGRLYLFAGFDKPDSTIKALAPTQAQVRNAEKALEDHALLATCCMNSSVESDKGYLGSLLLLCPYTQSARVSSFSGG